MKLLLLALIFVAQSALAFDLSAIETREIPVGENDDVYADLLDLTRIPLDVLNAMPLAGFERAVGLAILALPEPQRPSSNPATECRRRFGSEFRFSGTVRSSVGGRVRASYLCARIRPSLRKGTDKHYGEFKESIEILERTGEVRGNRCKARPRR